jgi:hypothetical protein
MEPVSNSDGGSHERDPLKEEHSELLAPSQGNVKEIEYSKPYLPVHQGYKDTTVGKEVFGEGRLAFGSWELSSRAQDKLDYPYFLRKPIKPPGKALLIDKNSLWGGLNILGRRLCVKGI